jgi:hypothetical protein
MNPIKISILISAIHFNIIAYLLLCLPSAFFYQNCVALAYHHTTKTLVDKQFIKRPDYVADSRQKANSYYLTLHSREYGMARIVFSLPSRRSPGSSFPPVTILVRVNTLTAVLSSLIKPKALCFNNRHTFLL